MASNTGSNPGDVFEIRKIRRLIELMKEHDLSEIDLRQSDQRIRLRRGPETVTVAGLAPPAPISSDQAPGAAGSRAAEPENVAADDGKYLLIKSPMVGTFYVAASPDTPPFVKVGDQIGPETTVCIVEAMKVFNEIPAECSGTVVEVLVENGASVEFGQPLFRVQRIG